MISLVTKMGMRRRRKIRERSPWENGIRSDEATRSLNPARLGYFFAIAASIAARMIDEYHGDETLAHSFRFFSQRSNLEHPEKQRCVGKYDDILMF